MTQVGGDAATYIDPDNLDSAVSMIASRIHIRNQPCEKSLKNIERFGVSQMIGRYLKLYEMLLSSGKSNGTIHEPTEKGQDQRLEANSVGLTCPDNEELGALHS